MSQSPEGVRPPFEGEEFKTWAPDQPGGEVPQRPATPAHEQDFSHAVGDAAANQPAAESHLDANPAQGESEIADLIARQQSMPAHQPAVDAATEIDSRKLPAQPVKVDGRNRRSDNDALEGHFVSVVEGPHTGVYGSFDRVLQYGPDGYPVQILVRSRDEFDDLLSVAYDHCRPARVRGGR